MSYSLPNSSGLPPTNPLISSLRSIAALMLREMSSRYGQSVGGYIWAVLEPLGTIAILAIGFSLIIHNPPLGTSFILFYATGFLPFLLFQNVQLTVSRALIFSKPLLAYPALRWIDAILARFILNFLTSLLVTYILLVGILAVTKTTSPLVPGPILGALALAGILGLGIGVLNCFMMGMLPVWAQIWSIITRPLFLASGILVLPEDLPAWAQDILWFNPLIHVTALMRQGFYPMYQPPYVTISYTLFAGLFPLALGLLVLRKTHRDILSR